MAHWPWTRSNDKNYLNIKFVLIADVKKKYFHVNTLLQKILLKLKAFWSTKLFQEIISFHICKSSKQYLWNKKKTASTEVNI